VGAEEVSLRNTLRLSAAAAIFSHPLVQDELERQIRDASLERMLRERSPQAHQASADKAAAKRARRAQRNLRTIGA
jgi:hypothetical protein